MDEPNAIAALISADPAFRTLEASGAPIVALLGSPPQVIYGNPAAQCVFGVDPGARLLGVAEAGEDRLSRMLDQLRESAAPRLERLPLSLASGAQMVTLLARRLQGRAQDPYFVVAALGLRSSEAIAPSAEEEQAPPAHVTPKRASKREASGKPAGKPKTGGGSRGLREALVARHGGASARFLWKTDANDKFVEVTNILGVVAGEKNADLLGRAAPDAANALGLGPELSRALATRKSWSGVTVDWPLSDPECVVPTMLGALPIYEAGRRFAGFQGYGVMQLDQAKLERRRAAPPAEPQMTPPSIESEAPLTPIEPHMTPTPVEPEMLAVLVELEAPPPTRPTEPEAAPPPDPIPSKRERVAAKVVPLRPNHPSAKPREGVGVGDVLSPVERDAFNEIGRALGAAGEAVGPLPTLPETEVEGEDQDQAAQPAPPKPWPPKSALPKIEAETEALPAQPAEPKLTRETPNAQPASLAEEPQESHEAAHSWEDADKQSREAAEKQSWGTAEKMALQSDTTKDQLRRRAALLEVVPTGVLVARGAAALYANRSLLVLLGYPDLGAFIEDGGAERMFGGHMPIRSPRPSAPRPVTLLARDGEQIEVDALLQAVDWEDGPATLISLRRREQPQQIVAPAPPPPAVVETEEKQPPTPARKEAPPERPLRPFPITDEGKAFAVAFEAIGDPAAIISEAGGIELVNNSFLLYFDATESFCEGRQLADFFDPTEARRFKDFFDNVVPSISDRPAGPAFGEIHLNSLSQPERLKRLSIRRISARDILYICVISDAAAPTKEWADADRARKQAERASASKSSLLARVSHEIRTPLNAILGFAEVMREERFGPIGNDYYREYLRDIHASGTLMLSLVNDLLDLSKIEAGKMDLTFDQVDVNAAIAECVSLMQTQADRRRVVMRLSLSPRLPLILADERSLRQILLNLLSNAIKFTDAGGQVIVSSGQTDAGYVLIRVKDTGIGMSEEDIQIALEPFGQVANSRQTPGTGLGLPVTKALIEANRATFKIKSRKGEGTLIEVVFPPRQNSPAQ